jgi:hypothetical protein
METPMKRCTLLPAGGPTMGLLAALTLLVPLLLPDPALAQGRSFEYTEVTTVEASGLLGAMLSRAGGSEERRGIHVLDTRLRSDEGSTSMIFDAAAAEWTILEHDSRTYMTFSLADFQQAMAAMQGQMDDVEAAMQEMEAELAEAQAELEAAMAEARETMTLSVDIVNTGQQDRVRGYAANRHQIIVTLEDAEGIQGAEDVEGGALVLAMDIWASEELARENPLYEWHDDPAQNPFYQAMMENPAFQEMAEEWQSTDLGGSMEAFAMVDPRMGAALGEALEQLSEIQGMPVRTTSVVAVLPPAVELDTELLLAWEPSTMGDQLRGAASDAAREAARDAARDAVRGLTRGLRGRRGGGEEEPEVREEDLVIRPLVRVTTEVVEVHGGGVPGPELFQVPEGYQPLSLEMFQAPQESTGAGTDGR